MLDVDTSPTGSKSNSKTNMVFGDAATPLQMPGTPKKTSSSSSSSVPKMPLVRSGSSSGVGGVPGQLLPMGAG